MDKKKQRSNLEATHIATTTSKRTTIPSRDIGVTLRISEEALAKLNQIQHESLKTAQETKEFIWR